VITLVRHASTSWSGRRFCGRSDLTLSAEGEAEAALLAERLAPQAGTALRASPLRRAQQTARAIADRHGLLVETDDALREIDFGEVEGLTFDEI
jgi:broad specificity phosphatase PhoE